MAPDHPTVDFNQITEQIFLGTNLCCSEQSHVRILLDHGISADIDLEEERQEETPGVKTYLWLPVKDTTAPQKFQLDVGVATIKELVKNSKKVYVHCKNGHGRSPTLVAAYFISQGLDVWEAIKRIKEKRPEIHLEDAQIKALEEYRQSIVV